jgi:hypothetical protein
MPRLEKLDLRWVHTLQAPAWLDALEVRGCLVCRKLRLICGIR